MFQLDRQHRHFCLVFELLLLPCRKYGLRVAVLNDFEAAGYGITVISENDYVTLNAVPAAPQASSLPACMCVTWDRKIGNAKLNRNCS